jgi:hypothetical protein
MMGMPEMPLLPGPCPVEPHPVIALHRVYTSAKLKDRESFDFHPHEQKIRLFLDNLQLHACPDILNKNKVTTCRCLAGIVIGEELKNTVVLTLTDFAIMNKNVQHKLFFDRTLYAAALCRGLAGKSREERRKVYILPGTMGTMICKNAIARLLGYSRYTLQKIIDCVKKGKSPVHGLKNQVGNHKSHYDFNGMLKVFFEALVEHSAPRATRFVWTILEGTTREELRDEHVSELPPSFTKRRVYGRFLAEHGWKLKLDAKGRILTATKDDVTVNGKTPSEMPSWRTFLLYWKVNYPLIVIQ